jgi:hypothetical protein
MVRSAVLSAFKVRFTSLETIVAALGLVGITSSVAAKPVTEMSPAPALTLSVSTPERLTALPPASDTVSAPKSTVTSPPLPVKLSTSLLPSESPPSIRIELARAMVFAGSKSRLKVSFPPSPRSLGNRGL